MMLGLLGVLRQVGFSQGPGSHASRLLQLMAQPCVLANPASSFPAADGQQARGMATKKAGGTARQRPDTLSRNLGTKYLHNELVFPGMIIVRQRGTKWHPGDHVGMGKDHTLFARTVGLVQYKKSLVPLHNGTNRSRTSVSIAPLTQDKQALADMIQNRATIKRKLLSAQAHEASLFFARAPKQQHSVSLMAALASPLGKGSSTPIAKGDSTPVVKATAQQQQPGQS